MIKFLVLLLGAFGAFAVENCKDILDNKPYKGKISEVSEAISFKGCPDSLLVNEKTVCRLVQAKEEQGKTECYYSSNMAAFYCEI